MASADEIVAWVRSKGSDARNLRDAAHEASHALEVRPRRWDRESIHSKLVRKGKPFLVRTELEARAVERVVCGALGVTHDWEGFEFLAFVEASKSGVWLPQNLGICIRELMTSPVVVARAKIVMNMKESES